MTGPAISCPTCGSTSIETVNVKRRTVPRDLAAEYRAATGGPVGATIPQHRCGRCGCRWVPRTSEERNLRALSGQLGPEAMRAAQERAAAASRAGRSPLAAVSVRTWVLVAIVVAVILLRLLT